MKFFLFFKFNFFLKTFFPPKTFSGKKEMAEKFLTFLAIFDMAVHTHTHFLRFFVKIIR